MMNRKANEWASIKDDGFPDETAHDSFAVWNGKWWVKASYLYLQKHGNCFCDYLGDPIKGITHWKFVGEGPGL